MSETLQVILVTVVAAAALVVLVRSYLPGPQEPSRPAGCSNCASNQLGQGAPRSAPRPRAHADLPEASGPPRPRVP